VVRMQEETGVLWGGLHVGKVSEKEIGRRRFSRTGRGRVGSESVSAFRS